MPAEAMLSPRVPAVSIIIAGGVVSVSRSVLSGVQAIEERMDIMAMNVLNVCQFNIDMTSRKIRMSWTQWVVYVGCLRMTSQSSVFGKKT